MNDQFKAGMMKAADMCKGMAEEYGTLKKNAIDDGNRQARDRYSNQQQAISEMRISILTACETQPTEQRDD